MAIEGLDAIRVIREMLGAINGLKAAPGTIRGDFSSSRQMNLVHASDSPESAARELALYFQSGEICEHQLLITPAFLGYLKQTEEFSSAEYVKTMPLDGNAPNWRDQPTMYRWDNMAVIVHPNLPGVGTAAEKCFLYHRDAIGHAADVAGMDSEVGYDAEDAYSFARTSMNMGAKLLQNSGVFVFNHDGSAFAAE